MASRSNGLLASLFSLFFGTFLGAVLGVLGWRERERVRNEDRMDDLLHQDAIMIDEATMGEMGGMGATETVVCDLCGTENEIDPMAADPICEECEQSLFS